MIINPSTVSGSIALDGVTINQNTNNEIQAIGTVNPNSASGATAVLYDWEGTLQQYIDQNIATLHPEWICYINDDVQGGVSVYTKSECNNRFVLKGTHEIIECQDPTLANDWSWYRLYADDWVEQGGITEVPGVGGVVCNLLIQMLNANYSVQITGYTLDNSEMHQDTFWCTNRTTTNITVDLEYAGNTGKCFWEVKGKANAGV